MGTITPGAPADLVLLDYQPTTELTTHTLHAHLAHGLLRAPVTGVMVAGDVVLEDGRPTRLDAAAVAARARQCARRLLERLG
jgi:cytosine/adenosine deaminase-related metal-dependent hydrolase